jgi:branched-chain amino acid transport system permease protein
MSRRKLFTILSYSVLLILLIILPLLLGKEAYALHVLIMIGINIILVSSLRLIAATGQLSLCHIGMMCLGAYGSALLVVKAGISTWLALPIAGLIAMSAASIIGYPFTRLKGIYFAMATVFVAEVIRLVANQWRSLTGGMGGIIGIPRPDPIIIDGLMNVDFSSKTDFYYFILILVVVILLILYGIESSPISMTFWSVQQDEKLAQSLGINTTMHRILAFSIGSFFAGIAGAFYSHYVMSINPDTFSFLLIINVVVYAMVGGMRNFSGPILGAFVLTLVPELFSELKQFMPFVFAAVLILVMFFLPEGLVSLPKVFKKFTKKRLKYV